MHVNLGSLHDVIKKNLIFGIRGSYDIFIMAEILGDFSEYVAFLNNKNYIFTYPKLVGKFTTMS